MSSRFLGQQQQNDRVIVKTNELEEFEVKAIIAADGVNSEIAELTGARDKFGPHESVSRCKGNSKTARRNY